MQLVSFHVCDTPVYDSLVKPGSTDLLLHGKKDGVAFPSESYWHSVFISLKSCLKLSQEKVLEYYS